VEERSALFPKAKPNSHDNNKIARNGTSPTLRKALPGPQSVIHKDRGFLQPLLWSDISARGKMPLGSWTSRTLWYHICLPTWLLVMSRTLWYHICLRTWLLVMSKPCVARLDGSGTSHLFIAPLIALLLLVVGVPVLLSLSHCTRSWASREGGWVAEQDSSGTQSQQLAGN